MADEIWEKRKFTLLKKKIHLGCQEHCPLTALLRSSVREGGQNVNKFWPGTWPSILLKTDATLAGYSKHRRGWGGASRTSKENRLLKPEDSAYMEVQDQTTTGSFREKLDFYCVTRENICKPLTRPRHQEQEMINLHPTLTPTPTDTYKI